MFCPIFIPFTPFENIPNSNKFSPTKQIADVISVFYSLSEDIN